MGLGNLVKDVLSFGATARRRNRRARNLREQEQEQIRLNTELAEQMMARDRGQSAFTGMTSDPKLAAQQRAALGEMSARSRDGYTDLDRQAMTQQLQDVARYEQSQRASLAADARARGVTGSGMDIASQLLAQQAGADRAMQTGTDMALAGRDRAYRANADMGALAGQMRGQDFDERSRVAGAQDAYGQWAYGAATQDAQNLANARMGQAQSYGQQAGQMEQAFNEGIDQAIQIGGAIGNAYTGGAAGAVTGGAKAFGSGSVQGGSSTQTATPWIAGSPGGPPANAHTTSTYGSNQKAASPMARAPSASRAPLSGGIRSALGQGAASPPPAAQQAAAAFAPGADRPGLGRRPLSAARRRGPTLLRGGGAGA